MAANLLKAGNAVTVWNRTVGRGDALAADGAAVAATPREAVRDADFVLSIVRDDAASRRVWLDPLDGAADGMAPGAIALECSTLGLVWVEELGERLAGLGVGFLDAPVLGSRPQAEAGQLVFVVGGETAVLDRAMPVLSGLGTAMHRVGAGGAGAALKLAANALLGIQVAALAELIASLGRAGVDTRRAVEVLGATPVCSPAAKAAAASMLAGDFAPLFPAELVEKDLGYALAAAGMDGDAPMVGAARQVFAAAGRRGLGEDNLTGVVRLYRAGTA